MVEFSAAEFRFGLDDADSTVEVRRIVTVHQEPESGCTSNAIDSGNCTIKETER
jgi:hypothetical protein